MRHQLVMPLKNMFCPVSDEFCVYRDRLPHIQELTALQDLDVADAVALEAEVAKGRASPHIA